MCLFYLLFVFVFCLPVDLLLILPVIYLLCFSGFTSCLPVRSVSAYLSTYLSLYLCLTFHVSLFSLPAHLFFIWPSSPLFHRLFFSIFFIFLTSFLPIPATFLLPVTLITCTCTLIHLYLFSSFVSPSSVLEVSHHPVCCHRKV